MDTIHKISKTLLAVVLGAGIGLGIFIFAGQYVFRNFYTPYIVQSGSMEPALPLGSLVLVKPKSFYSVNEVITFRANNSNDLVTHRITEITYLAAQAGPAGTRRFPLYHTKGDANEDADPTTVQINQVVGNVRFLVPYVGYGVEFAKTPQGFLLLVIIPATIIVYEELKSVKSEIGKVFKKFGKKTRDLADIKLEVGISTQSLIPDTPSILVPATLEVPQAPRKKSFSKWAVILPIAGASFILTAATSAILLDQEASDTNTLGVATQYSPPITAVSINGLDQGGQQVSAQAQPEATPYVPTNLEISEVYYSPDAAHTINSSENESEWIEIHNPTGNSISLQGLSIQDNADCDDIPGSGIVPAGGMAILSRATRSAFETVWQIPEQTLFVAFAGQLGDGLEASDKVSLRNGNCMQTADDLDTVEWTIQSPAQLQGPTPGNI